MADDYTVVIRPSSGPAWNDCARRTAARLFREMIEGAGYELRRNDRTVGAAVGTSVHASAAFMLTEKMNGLTPAVQLVVEKGIAEFDATTEAEGCIYDEVTDNRPVAQKQIARMVTSYAKGIAPEIEPIAVEERLEADLGDGFILSGQADQVAREPNKLRDLKTGKFQRANPVQYGLYSRLLRAHGIQVDGLVEDFVPRVRLNKPQPDPRSLVVPIGPAEWAAESTIQDMKASVGEFVRRFHAGDSPPEEAFRANPQSQLCSSRYCPAWGTRFCRLHKGAE